MVQRLVSPRANIRALLSGVTFLRRHARLILEMARGEVTGRHKGLFLGSAWVIIHPLALTLLYLFVFAVVFAQRVGGTYELPLDYTAYILSGLIPWLTFQTSMSTSVVSITANSPLVKQFIFPIEILPIRDVVTSMVTWAVGVSATLVYIIVSQGVLMATWVLLPVVLAVQVMAMIGVAFILSTISVFFRDIKDIVSVACLMAIFLMPVVYLPGWVPKVFQPLLWANPFTYMTWVYQDVIYFGRIEHPVAWFVFFGWASFAFAGGYRLFARTKPMFGSLV